jgi:hypothetical protein
MFRANRACVAPTLTLSPNGPEQELTWPTSPRSSIWCIQNDFEPMVCSAQTVHLSCVKICNIFKWIEKSSTWPPHLGVPSGASKMFPVPMVRLAQTVHLYYTDTNTISKPCTYLTLTQTLTPSPNVLRQDSTWPTSPRSSIGCVQNDFRACDTFGANREPI